MSHPIKSYLEDSAFGVYRILLKANKRFDWGEPYDRDSIRIITGRDVPWTQRTFSGMYRNHHQVGDKHVALELIMDERITIPYEDIESCVRIGDLPDNY